MVVECGNFVLEPNDDHIKQSILILDDTLKYKGEILEESVKEAISGASKALQEKTGESNFPEFVSEDVLKKIGESDNFGFKWSNDSQDESCEVYRYHRVFDEFKKEYMVSL